LRTVLAWALEELSAAQTALRTQSLPPPDPAQGWGRFAANRLEWDAQAAVEVEALYLAYARWCTNHGEPMLAEEKVLAWLTARGATLRTRGLSQIRQVVGVRLTE
jgi:hypothetical protein